ncbi:MAG: branched-chain amino acid ABC transporter permease [Rhodospirillaceae bacterium]|nr:branched-chain amino acid ABC transporter permease [Rhodospirillaceae bacterium]
MSMAVSVIIDATLLTLTLALASLGLAIIYGLIGVINMGHGAMLTLGAYFTWAALEAHIPFVPAVLLAAAGVAVVGLVLEHLVVRHFYDRPFDTLLITWGFFLVTTEVIKLVFGSNIREVPNPLPGAIDIGVQHVPAYRSVLGLVTVALILGIGWVFHRTGLGLKIRALTQDREAASLLGLDIGRTYKLVFVFGCFLAGLAGALIGPMLSVDPYIGMVFLVRNFFVVIVGGIGQVLGGTFIGSFLIGGSETLFALFFTQTFAQTVVFALAILVLRFRPGGVLAHKGRL